MHAPHGVLDAACGAQRVQELHARLVEICVGAAEPRALATHAAVRRRLGQVPLFAHVLDLLQHAPRPKQPRAREREHQRGRWAVVSLHRCCRPEVAAAAHEHAVVEI